MPDTDEIVAEVSRSAISRTKPIRTDVSSFFDQGKSKRVPMTSHAEGDDDTTRLAGQRFLTPLYQVCSVEHVPRLRMVRCTPEHVPARSISSL